MCLGCLGFLSICLLSWCGFIVRICSSSDQFWLINKLVPEFVEKLDIKHEIDETIYECRLACTSAPSHKQIDDFAWARLAWAFAFVELTQLRAFFVLFVDLDLLLLLVFIFFFCGCISLGFGLLELCLFFLRQCYGSLVESEKELIIISFVTLFIGLLLYSRNWLLITVLICLNLGFYDTSW